MRKNIRPVESTNRFRSLDDCVLSETENMLWKSVSSDSLTQPLKLSDADALKLPSSPVKSMPESFAATKLATFDLPASDATWVTAVAIPFRSNPDTSAPMFELFSKFKKVTDLSCLLNVICHL